MTVSEYLNRIRLVEDPPAHAKQRFYIWHRYRVVWRGETRAAAEAWSRWSGIEIQDVDLWRRNVA